MRQLTLVALVWAAQASAAELQALILTGATSEAAARPLLEAAKQRAEESAEFLAFAPGFPKLVQSDTVKGLKPGFWIVLAGLCESTGVIDALKVIDAGAYWKPVQAEGPSSCPALVEGWAVSTREVKDASKRTLRGVLLVSTGAGQSNEWRLFVSLRERSGALVTQRLLKQPADSSCMCCGETELAGRAGRAGALVLESTDCLKMRGCPNPGEATIRLTITPAGQALSVVEKVLVDPGERGCSGE